MRAIPPALALAALLGLTACGGGGCPERPAPTPLDEATVGALTGRVTFTGAPPAPRTVPLGGDPGCSALHKEPVSSPDLVLGAQGAVQHAFVWVKDGLGDRVFAQPTGVIEIDQKGCLFAPRVVGAQTCQEIAFLNSDPVLHNVHGFPKTTSQWNFSLGVAGSRRTVRLREPEVMVRVGCDVHPWMQAYVGVLSHPYFAVTGADGTWAIRGLPPGDYVVASWHERLGTREEKVHLEPREEKTLAFAYPALAAN